MELTIVPGLTRRESEVLKMLSLGKCNKEIALSLCISIATAQNHLRNLYKKLQVRNRTEAAQKYWEILNEI
jgi:two-component system NarL family response regulator